MDVTRAKKNWYIWQWFSSQLLSGKKLVCICLVSFVSGFANPWTVPHQDLLSMEFSRREYWKGLPFPSAGDLLDQGLNLGLLHCKQILYIWAIREVDKNLIWEVRNKFIYIKWGQFIWLPCCLLILTWQSKSQWTCNYKERP